MGLPLKVVIFGLSIVIGASSFSGYNGDIGSGSGGSGFESGSGENDDNPTEPPTIPPDDRPDVPSDVDECSVFGTGSIKTFNSTLHYLQSTCTFVLSRSDSAASNAEFDIIIKRDMSGAFTKIQVTIDKTETVIENGNIFVDGESVSLPYDHKSIHVNNFGIYKRIESRRGFLSVFWDTSDNKVNTVWVQLRKDYRGKTVGLCGKYGVDDSDLQQLTEDNKISTYESCETETSESNCEETTMMCQNDISYYFFSCLPNDLIWPYMELCGKDTCNCANPAKCACAIYEEIVRQCPSDGIAELSPTWRDSQHCDEPSCPGNMIYSEAGPAVPKTCSNPTFSDDSQISTCQCPYGTVLDDLSGKNKCVTKKQCPCQFDGKIYESGEVRESLCQSCVCKSGQWDCENKDCTSRCTIEGGSAIKTFDGKTYSIYRNCKYITAVGEDWVVSITLRKCKNGICLTQVELSLQSEIFTFSNETVSVGSTVITDSYKSDSVVIFWQLSTYVQVQTSFGLKLQVQMAPNMQLYITLPVEAKGSTKGLCGNYNDKITDEFISSTGILEHSADNFAESWATGSCEVIPPPICIRSEYEQYGKEKCAQIRDPNGVFAPCHSLVEYESYVKQCEINTCLCERAQTCLCDALGNYAKACAAHGLTVTGWRGDDCVEECPATQHFLHNAFACNRTCRSLAGNDYACDVEDVPVDGCGCLEGQYMNQNGLCISKEECPCYYEQGMVHPGSTEIEGQNCNCTDGVLHCETPEPCGKNEIYVTCFNPSTILTVKTCSSLSLPMVGRTQCESGCYCQEGFYKDHNGVCVSVDDCACMFEDKIYNAGESVNIDCNKCTCSKGMWECTQKDCPGKCQVYGDGHYQTFDLKWYSYDGNCEYSLVEDYCGKDTGNFRITVESVPCCEEALTCSRAVTIELQDTEIELSDSKLTEKRIGSCRDNMIEYSAHTVGLYIIITTSSGITLIWDKHTRLTVILDPRWKGQVCGLCGNFDSDPTNDFKTRGKSLVTNVVEFGNSWKFDPSCGNIVNQSFPCEKHWYCSAWAQRRCSIIKDSVFQPCHNKVDPQPYYDVCVQESCVCEMEGRFLGFCTAVAAYAEACNEAEVCIKWRTPDLCPVFCDYYNEPGACSWHYEPCGTPAIKTCSNNEVGKKYAAKLEGCYAKCPDNTPYLDENTMTCSTLDNCTCFHNGIIHPGETITNECNQTCTCTNGVLSCTGPPPTSTPTQPPTEPEPTPTQPKTPQPPTEPEPTPTQPKTQPPTAPEPTPTQPKTLPPPTESQTSQRKPKTSPEPTLPNPKTMPTTTTTKPQTARLLSTTGLPCSGTWTDWVNKNSPTPANGGDHETTDSLCSPGSKVENIQCEPVNPNQLMQNVICNKESGLICHNGDQSLKNNIHMCADYQIRVCCSNTVPTNPPPPTPTEIVTPSPPCICEGNQENTTFVCGETWIDGCSNCTCVGHNLIERIPFTCPQIPKPKCDNDLEPDLISDGCCPTYDCGCKCEVFGDPHYLTFSGVQYAFLSDCTYILVQEKKTVYGFSVAVDNYYCIPGLKASCAKGMFITYLNNSLTLTITKGNILSILNGNVVKPPIYLSGIQMQTTKTVVTVYIEDIRTFLSLSIYNTINIQVPRQYFGGNTQGQCGECGGHSCIRRDGTQEPDTCCDKTAYEWIINDPTKPSCKSAPKHVPCQAQSTSKPTTTVTKENTSKSSTKTSTNSKQTTTVPHKSITTVPTIKQTTRAPHKTTTTMPTTKLPPKTTPKLPNIPICDILNNTIFDECRAQVDLTVYENACIFDHNLLNNSQVDCSSISRAAGRCKEANICVNWRHLANGSCDISCDKGMVFDECHTDSDDYCQGGMQYSGGSLAMMMAGCFCPKGLMLADKFKTVCVSECPCCKGPLGEPKMVGDTWISNCHICTCNNLTLTEDCQPIKCPPVPSCSDGEIFVPQYSSSGCCTIGNCVKQTCVTQVSNVTVQYKGCTGVVQVAECQGQCQSGASFSANSGKMTQSCTCCLPNDTEKRTVRLNCPGSSVSNYNYSYVNSCRCSPCSDD